jgi:hypothetical protein
MLLRRYLFVFAVGTTAAACPLVAETPRSPFMPPAVAVEAGPESTITEDAELQFCGIFGDGEAKRFLIFNVTTKRSSWLQLNQEGPDELFVEGFDDELSTVSVRQGGRSMTLALQAASFSGGGGSNSPPPVALTGNSQQDLVNTVRVNPTPSDERRRLEAVAAEVRRRRAARAAAAAGAPAPAAP